jgi:hypothetical protein
LGQRPRTRSRLFDRQCDVGKAMPPYMNDAGGPPTGSHANGRTASKTKIRTVIMRTLALCVMAAMLAAPLATPVDAAPRDRDRTKVYGPKQYRYNSDQRGYRFDSGPNGQSGDCAVTGWRDSSNTPIFRCPGEVR